MAAPDAPQQALPDMRALLDALKATRDVDTSLKGACKSCKSVKNTQPWHCMTHCSQHGLQRPCHIAHSLSWFTRHTHCSPCAGLQTFRQYLHGPAASHALDSYLAVSPQSAELQALWDAQLSAKHADVLLELLGLVSDLLAFRPSSDLGAKQEAGTVQHIVTALDALAGSVLQRRLKSLYFNLTSGKDCCHAFQLGT